MSVAKLLIWSFLVFNLYLKEDIPMEQLKIPTGYHADLNLHDTQVAIKTVKDFFQQSLAQKLNLLRVSAPIFVDPTSGLNDNLNGVERPVSFDIKGQDGEAEIVHSLAKWKRYALKKYGFAHGEGLYTDMVAIRRDEDLDNIHSVYVDQWDWEKIISKEERTMDTLISTVRTIYSVLRKTEKYMAVQYDYIEEFLPKEISFVTTQELVDMYPDCTPKEREYKIVKEKGAVFIMQVGKTLTNGERHDGRAPDYDDWELNGDIVVYYPVLDIALELSSMGIRVDEEALDRQLSLAGCDDRRELAFQKAILNKELPYTIGGGIGQSRICMFFLRKAHIGEVHVSLWPKEVQEQAAAHGINLL
jgi:aspartate--ammonia ligase